MALNRREFLKTTAAALAAAPLLQAQRRAGQSERRPNIFVIMTDEHNRRIAGYNGNKLVRTPNLDELAGRGVVFEDAYCNSPLCVPSRLAFTTGKYIHRVSAWNNDCSLPSDDFPSLPHILNAAGYESFLCGKQHYAADRRYGFIEIGGNMNNGVMTGHGGRRKADDTTVNEKAGQARAADFHTGDESAILNHDRRVTAGVLDFLGKRTRSEKPFFLFAGYLAPHFPLIVPAAYYQNYRGQVGLPKIPEGFFENMPLNYKHLRWGFGLVNYGPELTQRGRELYYGLTEWVDNEIGKVLGALRKGPFADDTVVLYTTDHGENMGEHGLWWKNCVYEQAAHIPMVASWPQRWAGGQRRAGACAMVDLVKTIAEVGGARTPGDWNGNSMAGWLDDPKTRWRDLAVSEYYAHNIASGYAMLRAGDWKYVYHNSPDDQHPAERELYNFKADPQEFNNLAKKPGNEERIGTMHAALLKELGEDPEETERRCRAETAKGYGNAPGGRKRAAAAA
jgi:choline-sulfatase